MKNRFTHEYMESKKSRLEARLDVKKAKMNEADKLLASELQQDINRIQMALWRIEEDQYHLCYHCGVPIEEELLELIPESLLCSQCKCREAN